MLAQGIFLKKFILAPTISINKQNSIAEEVSILL
jgi:hypothetical protein